VNQQPSDTIPEISVVVPVHNEEENIEPLVDEIRAALTGRRYEIVYVDDGSTDRSLEILLELAGKYPELPGESPRQELRAEHRYPHRREDGPRSLGGHPGRRRSERSCRHPPVDGTDGRSTPSSRTEAHQRPPPHRPPELKLINGHRHKRKDTWVKRMSSKVANFVRRSLLHDDTPDSGCGLKLFSREAWLDLPFFDHIHRFTPALFLANGHQVRSVKVHHRPRVRGKSKYGIHNRLWVGIVDLLGVIWLLRRTFEGLLFLLSLVGIVDLLGVIWLLRRTTRPRLKRLQDFSSPENS